MGSATLQRIDSAAEIEPLIAGSLIVVGEDRRRAGCIGGVQFSRSVISKMKSARADYEIGFMACSH